jgi:hypothetical protein
VWRIASRGYARYAVICRTCGKRRGWSSRAQAERHAADLVDAGWEARGWRIEPYEPHDGLCAGAHDALESGSAQSPPEGTT